MDLITLLQILLLLFVEQIICNRLSRQHLAKQYVKNLSLLERDLSQTIIVDDRNDVYKYHPRNGINCYDFNGDEPNSYQDNELTLIGDFLIGIKDCEDVRDHCPYVLYCMNHMLAYACTKCA